MTLVSVIITTRDEEINIKNCLESIKNQDFPREKIEIIVVDNNSTDRTKEIAKRYTDNPGGNIFAFQGVKVYNYVPEWLESEEVGFIMSRTKRESSLHSLRL